MRAQNDVSTLFVYKEEGAVVVFYRRCKPKENCSLLIYLCHCWHFPPRLDAFWALELGCWKESVWRAWSVWRACVQLLSPQHHWYKNQTRIIPHPMNRMGLYTINAAFCVCLAFTFLGLGRTPINMGFVHLSTSFICLIIHIDIRPDVKTSLFIFVEILLFLFSCITCMKLTSYVMLTPYVMLYA